MEKLKDFFHDFSDIFFAIIIAGIMFTVLVLNLGNWFDDFPDAVLANESTNTSEKQNNDSIHNKPDNLNEELENKNNQLKTENENNETEIENLPDNKSQDNESQNNNTQENESQNNNTQDNESQNNGDVGSSIDKTEKKDNVNQKTKKITIPKGTFTSGIAEILKEKKLINNTDDFIHAAEKLNLSNRLKFGSFEIPINATTEDMAKIIAGQKEM